MATLLTAVWLLLVLRLVTVSLQMSTHVPPSPVSAQGLLEQQLVSTFWVVQIAVQGAPAPAPLELSTTQPLAVSVSVAALQGS